MDEILAKVRIAEMMLSKEKLDEADDKLVSEVTLEEIDEATTRSSEILLLHMCW
jgi:hypothetical protein